MTDRLTAEQCRKAMKNVHSKDASVQGKTEKTLWNKGIRYRNNMKGLPGTSDIAITRRKIAVLCDMSF